MRNSIKKIIKWDLKHHRPTFKHNSTVEECHIHQTPVRFAIKEKYQNKVMYFHHWINNKGIYNKKILMLNKMKELNLIIYHIIRNNRWLMTEKIIDSKFKTSINNTKVAVNPLRIVKLLIIYNPNIWVCHKVLKELAKINRAQVDLEKSVQVLDWDQDRYQRMRTTSK